ncbi:hypothetical protein QNI16_23535 [Cytophagaceae bacterium YF14B1]|uniref:SCP domain-containing protein n=1 Tax=Xanthocytophaga flava TaxID=3048013 RepID=A0AAE3QUF7_9BACT|nr:hypothetical protein [Xanthocytophaga flavus]MDJ1483491.1 hypothetical protein [Xanthocytophaga flavus]
MYRLFTLISLGLSLSSFGQKSVVSDSSIKVILDSIVKADSTVRMRERIKDGWPIFSLNTADSANYMYMREKEMILEINMCRSNPKKYAQYVKKYKGNKLYVHSLIAELNTTPPLPLLKPDKDIYLSARRNGEAIKEMDGLYHLGGLYAENLYRGYGEKEEREVLLALLVDDINNNPKDPIGHRCNLLDPDYRWIGVYGSIFDSTFWVQQFK